jgi:hypothetical protein
MSTAPPDDALGVPAPSPRLVPAHGRRPAGRRHWGRWVVLGVVVLVLVLAGAAAWTVKGAFTARDQLTSALADVPTVEDALKGGDTAAAQAALTRVQEHTRTARHATDGPVWAVATVLPGVGEDAKAFRTSTRSVDDLARGVLPPLVTAAKTVDLSSVKVTDGRIDLAPLETAAPLVQAASDRLDAVTRSLDSVDPSGLRSQLVGPVTELKDKVADLDGTVATVHRATALLPTMLGGHGTRRYLLLSLNNAELRSSGGIPGSIAELQAKDGKVTIVRTASSADLGPWDKPVATIPKGDHDLFGDQMGRYPQDTTMSADFPTTARLTAAMWKKSGRGAVDGVLATDPVALSHVLGATGPVEVSGTQLTPDNAVDVLLSQVYAAIPDPTKQDEFFSAASGAVFAKLMSGSTSASSLQKSLTQAADEHRLLVWSADPTQQALLAGTELSGALTTSDRGKAALGVFLNDGTVGKMDYYLRSEVKVVKSVCSGSTRIDTVDVTLHSDAPKDAQESLPSYVTGEASHVVKPGVIRTNVAVFTPVGVHLPVLTIGKKSVGGNSFTAWDRTQTQLTQDLRPGQTVTLTMQLATPAAAASRPGAEPGSLELWSTPTTTSDGLSTLQVATCG